MTAAYNYRTLICMAVLGICFLALGVVMVLKDSMIMLLKHRAEKHFTLINGREGLHVWLKPVPFLFKCYLFHVNNPDDVLKGAAPILTEIGPFVYSEIRERIILSVDEETDEILYMSRHTFTFNKKESGNLTEEDEITMLNPAYLGTINLLSTLSSDFMDQYGNNIAKLFPPASVVFVKGKAGDILFHGMRFTCNSKRYKELALICSTLESNKPAIVRDGPRPGMFLYSYFQKGNNTLRGPFRVKRGKANRTEIGTITEYQGRRIQKIWATKECNTVWGSDGVSWAPMPTNILNEVFVFSEELCRNLPLYYQHNKIINGMLGYLYVLTSKIWEPDEIDCYCPVVAPKKTCLPKGILDISSCQGLPVLLSEPHFLHGDPALLQFAQGLKPRESVDAHQSYVIIEPLTGAPLSGLTRTQLNMKLAKQPVDLLTNTSEGYFPLVWCEEIFTCLGSTEMKILLDTRDDEYHRIHSNRLEGATADASQIPETFQALRLLYVVWYMQYIPLILGVHLLLVSVYSFGIPKRKAQVSGIVAESLVVSPGSFVNTITGGPPRRRRLFE